VKRGRAKGEKRQRIVPRGTADNLNFGFAQQRKRNFSGKSRIGKQRGEGEKGKGQRENLKLEKTGKMTLLLREMDIDEDAVRGRKKKNAKCTELTGLLPNA